MASLEHDPNRRYRYNLFENASRTAVACLYCGKEIGPIRLLRDSEFCSPKHRKDYKDRLRKVLVQVGEPESVPAQVAPFFDPVRPRIGNQKRSSAAFDFSTTEHRTRLPQSWTLTIPEPAGRAFARRSLAACDGDARVASRPRAASALPYFGPGTTAGLLALSPPKLGAVILRSSDGAALSLPITLNYAQPRTKPAVGKTTAPANLAAAPAAALALPPLILQAAECADMLAPPKPEYPAPPQPAEARMPGLAPEPAVRWVAPSLAVALPAIAALRLPEAMPLADLPVLSEAPPEPCESWMPGRSVEPAASIVQPSWAGASRTVTLSLPAALAAPPRLPQPALQEQFLPGRAPQAAQIALRSAAPGTALSKLELAAPALAALTIADPSLPVYSERWQPVPESEPATCDAWPVSTDRPVQFAGAPMRLAPLALEPVRDQVDAQTGFVAEPAVAVPAAPAPSSAVQPPPPQTRPAAQIPELIPVPPAAAARSTRPSMGTASVRLPQLQSVAAPQAALPPSAAHPQPPEPRGDLFSVDYRYQRGPESPLAHLDWCTREVHLRMPRFAVRPIFDRLEDSSPQKRGRKTPAFAEIFSMPDAAALGKRPIARHAMTAVAASVTVAIALWFGANAGRFGKDLISRDASDLVAARARSHSPSPTTAVPTTAEAPRTPPSAWSSPVAWVRAAAAKRAAVELTDSFKGGMEAWGAKTRGWVPGWSRHPDGYVRPGQLALFRPTLNFTDYRMEFFGQIENQSMSWVVRGKDTQNYYAMKFNVVQPGLRPVISMVHYPVIGGKAGHKIEMPLSVMVHNNTPYHVAVDVKGSHYVASIEGQEVDEWSDDSLLAGGVGFFSEAGARARIYWMKVSKNDDWFGRICGFLAGGADSQAGDTAWLERPAIPIPAPERPLPPPSAAAVWSAEMAETFLSRTERGRASVKGGFEKWSS